MIKLQIGYTWTILKTYVPFKFVIQLKVVELNYLLQCTRKLVSDE